MKRKPYIIAVVANRGGVGKSTTAAALVSNLSMRRDCCKYTLGLSLDAQGDLDDLLAVNAAPPDGFPTVKDQLLTTGVALRGYGIDLYYPAYLVPSDMEMLLVPDFLREKGQDFCTRFLDAIGRVTAADYHYVVIDCPPSLNDFMRAAISAADGVVVVAEPVPHDVKQISNVIAYANAICQHQRRESKILGILFTKDGHFKVNTATKALIEEAFPGLPFKTSISRTVLVQEAVGRSLFRPFSKNVAVKQYEDFTEEVVERIKKNEDD